MTTIKIAKKITALFSKKKGFILMIMEPGNNDHVELLTNLSTHENAVDVMKYYVTKVKAQ